MSVVRGRSLILSVFLTSLLLTLATPQAAAASVVTTFDAGESREVPSREAGNCLTIFIPPHVQPESCAEMAVDFVLWTVNEIVGPLP